MNSKLQQKIIQEAMNFFMLYGIKSTSMDMVANSLQISKRTLYESFPGKDELLKTCVSFSIKKAKEIITDIEKSHHSSLEIILNINDTLLQQTLSFCPAFYRDIKCYQHIIEEVNSELKTFVYNRLLIACNYAVNEGYIMPDYNFDFLLSFFEGNLTSFYLGKTLTTENQLTVFRYTIQVYLTGICTDKGRDFLKKILSQKKSKNII